MRDIQPRTLVRSQIGMIERGSRQFDVLLAKLHGKVVDRMDDSREYQLNHGYVLVVMTAVET